MYFLGLDVGTTSTKAIAVSPAGVIKGFGTQDYPIVQLQPGWAEQDPEVLWEAVILAVREAVTQTAIAPGEIAALGLSTAMHSLIVVDNQGQPLTHTLIWADNRSAEQAEALKFRGQGGRLYQQTGVPIHPMSPLTKLLWLRLHQPEIFAQAAKFISFKEFLLYRWFNHFVVDHGTAATTGLLNLETWDWDENAIALAGIRQEQLSELVPVTTILQGMKLDYAEAMGLLANTPVVVGASDGACAVLGVGAGSGQTAITIGTSAAVRTLTSQPSLDPQGRTFCYAFTSDRWLVGGASNNGGVILQWFRDQLGNRAQTYEDLLKEAEAIAPGADGLLCLPYLTGERAPLWNADARGVFFGVSLHHQPAHFVRAILEGILFNVFTIHQMVEALTRKNQEIRVSGGFARSPVGCQMMADILSQEILIPKSVEGSAFGAVLLAMIAVGNLPDLTAATELIQIQTRYQPNEGRSQQYREIFALWQPLYQHLSDDFTRLADWRLKRS